MPSIFSIGRTLSRTIPSIRSSSLRRKTDTRASSVSTFSASLRRRCASASTAARMRSTPTAMRCSSASFCASSSSILAPAIRNLGIARGLDLLLRAHRLRAYARGLDSRLGPLLRLREQRDLLVHLGQLDGAVALDLQAAEIPVAVHAGLVEPAVGGDPGALDSPRRPRCRPPPAPGAGRPRAARGPGGTRAAPLRAPCPARPRWSRPPGPPRSRPAAPAARRRCSRPPLRRHRDVAVLLRDLHRLALVDLQHLAVPRGRDSLRVDRELLCDPGRLDRLSRRDLRLLDGAVALDLQRTHGFLARHPFRRDRLPPARCPPSRSPARPRCSPAPACGGARSRTRASRARTRCARPRSSSPARIRAASDRLPRGDLRLLQRLAALDLQAAGLALRSESAPR